MKSELPTVALWAWIAMTLFPETSCAICRSIAKLPGGLHVVPLHEEHSWSAVASCVFEGGVPTTLFRATSWPLTYMTKASS